jgi:hypothetical protein
MFAITTMNLNVYAAQPGSTSLSLEQFQWRRGAPKKFAKSNLGLPWRKNQSWQLLQSAASLNRDGLTL